MMAEDLWQHRAKGMRRCRTCMFWVQKGRDPGQVNGLGRCRRHAPTLGGWPATFEEDWCGDHKLDETKLALMVPPGEVGRRPGPETAGGR